jgi:hypothetical protein
LATNILSQNTKNDDKDSWPLKIKNRLVLFIHRRTYLQLSDVDYVQNNTGGICSQVVAV